MSPSRLPTEFYQMPASDSEMGDILKLNEEDTQFIKHEVTDAEDRTDTDVYYDTVALSFLLDVAPLFPLTESAGTASRSPAEVAKTVHAKLQQHLEANKSIPIHLPDDYPSESVPHLRSVARRLWVYLIKGVVLNVSRPISDDTLDFIASFFKEFFAYARQQSSWKAWEAQTDDDLRLSWVMGDYLGESPPWYVQAGEETEEYRSEVRAFNRSAKFSAYLVKEGYPYHFSFWKSVVAALGKHGDGEQVRDPKEADNAILILPQVLDIAGDVLRGVCFGEVSNNEKLAELEKEIKSSQTSLADYSKENWEYWKTQATQIANSAGRDMKVREAAGKVEEKLRIA